MANPFDQFDAPAANPFDKFDEPANPKQNKGIGGDVVTALKQGVQQLPGIATGLADIATGAFGLNRPVGKLADRAGEVTGFQPSKWSKEAEQEYSDATKEGKAKIDQAWDDPNTNAGDVAGAYLANPRATALNAVKSVPAMLAGGVAAKGLGIAAGIASAPARAAIGEGAVMAGSAMDQTDPTTDPQRAAAAAAATGIAGGLVGYGGGRLAQRLGITDFDALTTGGTRVGAQAATPIYKRIPAGMVQEGLIEEAPQSAIETASQNWAEGKPLTQGMARNVTEGALAGGMMGGVGGALPQNMQAAPVVPPPPGTQNTPTPGTPPLQIGNTPDPLLSFADGTVARQSEVDKFINGLPPEQQPAARAKLMGMAPQPVKPEFADILNTESVYATWSNVRDGSDRQTMQDEMGYVQKTYGPIATEAKREEIKTDLSQQFKWFRAAKPSEQAAAIDALIASPKPAPQPAKPSEAMGLAPTAAPSLTNAAIVAVDTGVHQGIALEDAAAADQAAYEQATAEQQAQAAQQDTADKPITTGPLADATLSEDDKRAVLYSNQAVADGGEKFTGTQDGDILNGMGAPFATKFGAQRRARMEGKDWTIATVFDGYVARRKDALNDASTTPAGVDQPATPTPSDQPIGGGMPAVGPLPAASGNAGDTGASAAPAGASDPVLDAGSGADSVAPFDVTHAGTAAIANPKNASVVEAYNKTQFATNPDGSKKRVGRDHFESWANSGGVTSDVGSQYDGHGIAKGNPLGALLNILENGINTSRRFDSAPLTPASSSAGAGSGLGSANGAYKDGPFILLGARGKSIMDGIKTVLVSDEVAASIPALQQRFPDVRFVSHSNAQSVLSQDSAANQPVDQTEQAQVATESVASLKDALDQEHEYGVYEGNPAVVRSKQDLESDYGPLSDDQVSQLRKAYKEGADVALSIDQPNSTPAASTQSAPIGVTQPAADPAATKKANVEALAAKLKSKSQPTENTSEPKTDQAIKEKPQAPTSEAAVAPKKITPNQRIAANLQARADYFTPGNIVQGYSGHDRVISYKAPDGKGEGWNVTVQSVVKQDGQWVVDLKDNRVRTHSTMPEKADLARGPVDKAPKPVAPQLPPNAPTNTASTNIGFSNLEKEMHAKAKPKEFEGAVGVVMPGSLGVHYATLADAVAVARKAIAAGTRPVPFQIHNATSILLGDADRVIAALDSEPNQPAAPAVEQVPEKAPEVAEITHNGTRIYKTRIAGRDGAPPSDMWAVESQDNKRLKADGKRTTGGDSLHASLDEAKSAADLEANRDAQDQASKAEIAARDKAERDAAQAKKDANKGKSIVERRKDAILDGATKLPVQAGLGNGTKRESMQKAVDQERAIVEKMVDDTAAKKRDNEAIDLVRAKGFILGLSNENLPVVKAGLEAQARLKANDYKKPSYRVHSGRDTNSSFYEISKTEYDYAQELKAQPKDPRENYIRSAADSIGQLRKSDVDRVLNGLAKDNIDGVTRTDLAAYIKEKHPDYAQEVDDVMAEIEGQPASKVQSDLVAGDRFKDAKGNEFQVWSARQGRIEAHPVVDGKPVVNRDSVQRWATTDAVRGANPEYRTDIVMQPTVASPVHQDPGKAPEVATAPVVAKSIAKAARNEDQKPSEMRKWLLGEIDKAVKLTEDYADYQKSVKDNGQDVADSIFFGKRSSSTGLTTPQGKGTVTFDVPGDGKFKIRNSLRGLMEFRAKVEGKSGTGFTDKPTKPKGLPASTGVAKGSSNQIEALTNMLEELDFEAAVDYARETGVSLNDAKVPPHIRDQLKAYLKDGTLPPAPFSPTRYWEYQASSRADKDGNPIREASLTKEIGADTYIASVTGTNATGFTFTVTKGAETFEKKSGTFRTFSDALQGAESKINAIQPEVVKPKDTGWNMLGTGYAGKRYIGRNITLDDGREVVARIYENAGQYEEAEVKVDGARVFAKADRYKAEKLADDFIATLTAKATSAAKAQPKGTFTPAEIAGIANASVPYAGTPNRITMTKQQANIVKSLVKGGMTEARAKQIVEDAVTYQAMQSRGGTIMFLTNDNLRQVMKNRGLVFEEVAPAAVQVEAPAEPDLDLKGFTRTPKGNGEFDLVDGNLYVTVKPTAYGFQANQGMSAKSGPRLTEQQAIEWAAALRDESKRIQKQEAKPAKVNSDAAAAVPKAVQDQIKWAITQLRDIEAALESVLRARGDGHILALEVKDQEAKQVRPNEILAEFREHAKKNGVDAEAVIDALGGAPDLARFSKEDKQPEASDEPLPAVTEAQARKQFEWRNMGQKDGTKSHMLFWFEQAKDKGTGAAMNRGEVSLYPGASGWKLEGGDGTTYKSLADAKAAAIDAAIPNLQDNGYVLKPAQAAAAILDAANITGKERVEALKDVKKGDITPEELEAAYPAKAAAPNSKTASTVEKLKTTPVLHAKSIVSESDTHADVLKNGRTFYASLEREGVDSPAFGEAVLFDEKGWKYITDERFAKDQEHGEKKTRSEQEVRLRVSLLPKAKEVIANADFIEETRVEDDDVKRYSLIGRFDDGDAVRVIVEERAADGKKFLSVFDLERVAKQLNRSALPAPVRESKPSVQGKATGDDSVTGESVAQPAAEGKPAKIEDVGEKIGGARKDTAGATGPRLTSAKDQDDRPTWAKRFQISQIAGGFDISVRGQDVTGKWTISDTRNKDRFDQPKQMGGYFDTKEEAEAALPLLAVAQKHRVTSTAKGADGEYRFEIWRDISDRKRVKVVDKVFDTRIEAMEYLAKNAQAILETSTTFGEADLPKPESTTRVGVERRTGDVKGEDFQSAFGFRGVEFGNWNNQDERQEVMNEAYDGLMDLAEVMGVPPKAIGLNGDLALAFGARGQGLNSARAHYERNRAVMNLTKMNGAGALAHEWFHALDHYLGRQDGKASAQWKINPDGTRSLDVKGAEDDMASGGFRRTGSGVRQELRDAYTKLIQTLFYKAEQYVDDTAKADKFVAASRGELEKQLATLRQDLSEQKDVRYYKRNNKPASAEQLAEFDAIAAEFVEGRGLATEWKSFPGKSRMSIQSRHTNDALEKLSEIYKAVRGRSGFDATNHNGVMDALRQYITRYEQRLKLLADANNETSKTKNVPTNFAMDAKSMDQGRGTDYWTTPHEMAARAFQGYVEDMISAKEGRSPFLNYAPENSGVLTPWGVKRPYPSGDERKAMNAEFDNFVGLVQTKETEQGVAMFSQGLLSPASFGPKPTPDQIKGLVDKVLQVSKNIVPVSVIGNPSQIAGIQVPIGAKPKGALIDGRIYLFSDNIQSFGDAYVTLFHELFHLGLQKVIPAEDYATMLRQFSRNLLVQKYMREWKASPEGVEKAAKMPSAAYEALATEEAMAMISEELSANDGIGARKLPGLVKTMLSWFAGVADRLGFPVHIGNWMRKLTQNDAEKFVTDMVRASMGGDKNLARTQAKYGTQAAEMTAQTRLSAGPANQDIRFSQGLGDTLASAANNVRDGLNKATITDLKHQFGNRLSDFRGLGLQTLGRRQLVDLYAGDLPQMEGYSRMVAQMDADKNESGAEADALATGWGKLKDERQLAELMHDATLAQIDPDKAFVEGDDQNFYDALRDGFTKLTPEAKTAYRKARDMYSGHNDKVRDAIRERIMRSEMSSAKKQALLTKMDGEFFKKVKGVYFPLARFGQYVTIVKDSAGNVLSANRSETMNEAEATRKILLAKFPATGGYKVGKVLKDKEFNAARDGVGRGFMADLFETLDKTNAGEELIDSISQLYLAALPDLSWAKHGIHRKGTPGFSQDARRAFAQNMFHGARYLAKLRYADQLQTKLDDMHEHIASKADDATYDTPKAIDVYDEMVKRHDSMMNPATNPISTALTSFGFVFHLGLSPASALVNLSQTALVAYPVMGSKWGFGKASAALMNASRQAAGNKNDISKALQGEELAAYNEAVRAGVIDVTMAHDLAGIAQGEDSKVSAKIRPVMKAASFLFHHAEKFNRQVTFVAAYRLAKESGAGHLSAYDQAVKATYDGHFDYSASNRPRVMQGNVVKVLLLFKQYAQNMVYTLTRQAQLSLNGATPAERTEARKALGGLLVSHALAAGALGLPMVGMLLSAASAIGGDDDEPWDAKVALQNMLADTLGQKPAEVFAHGLSRLTPWDISGRVGLDKLLLPDAQEGLEGADAVKNWMAAALGPVAGIAVNAGKGMQDMANGQYARGLESMLPSALRAPLKAYRYGTEGNIDKSGVAINDEIGAAGVVGQALGFSPSEARLAQEGKSAIYSADRAIQERRSSLTRQFALAAMAKDTEGMADARKDIARFNEKNPKTRITPINLMQSVRARRKRIEQAEQGVYLPKKRQDAIDAGRFAVVE